MALDKVHVLLVEEKQENFEYIQKLLKEAPFRAFQLDWTRDFEGAKKFLKELQHDIYLVDYQIGSQKGLELLSFAHQEGNTSPFILFTESEDSEIDLLAMEQGAADYLVKDQLSALLLGRSIRYAISQSKAIAALKQSEERYALAIRGANDGLWDWKISEEQIYFSTRWKAMLGYEPEEIGSDVDEWFKRVHPEELSRLKTAIRGHIDGILPYYESQYRMLHKDGTYRWMLSRGVVVRDSDGNAYRMAGSQTDVTDRALHDALTNLPNRALFRDRLWRAMERMKRRQDYMFAVLMLDLDRFKVVNDSLGPVVGDRMLMAIARRLEACLRPGDTVARLGGDEFVILLDEIKEIKDATRVANRIQMELAHALHVDGQEIYTTASIGIALSVSGYTQPEDILRDADRALTRAKRHGKDRHEIFDSAMHANASELLQLETDLRKVTNGQEFSIHYQPLVSLGSGKIMGVEALVRWQHPKRGLIYPLEFIPLAEETGLITTIGLWVFREACHQLKRWKDVFSDDMTLMMSINLSSKQFTQPDLVDKISQVIKETGIEASHIKLELTESILMDDTTNAIDMLHQLKSLGLKLCIDDFGTGYSSLSYLHRFPIDTLKIDRSFISGAHEELESPEIISTIVALAHTLNMDVIAEGIETHQQLDALRELECEYGQGYFFSRPVKHEIMEILLQQEPQW